MMEELSHLHPAAQVVAIIGMTVVATVFIVMILLGLCGLDITFRGPKK